MKIRHHRLIAPAIGFATTAAFTFVLGGVGSAHAVSRTHGAGFCRVAVGTESDDLGFNQVSNGASSGYLYLGCPLLHDSYMSVANINDLDVYGHDGSDNDQIYVSLCSSGWTAGVVGGDCLASQTTGNAFTGDFKMDFSTFPSGWNSAPTAYWPYLNVSIPAKDGIFQSSIRGYRWTTP